MMLPKMTSGRPGPRGGRVKQLHGLPHRGSCSTSSGRWSSPPAIFGLETLRTAWAVAARKVATENVYGGEMKRARRARDLAAPNVRHATETTKRTSGQAYFQKKRNFTADKSRKEAAESVVLAVAGSRQIAVDRYIHFGK